MMRALELEGMALERRQFEAEQGDDLVSAPRNAAREVLRRQLPLEASRIALAEALAELGIVPVASFIDRLILAETETGRPN